MIERAEGEARGRGVLFAGSGLDCVLQGETVGFRLGIRRANTQAHDFEKALLWSAECLAD